MKIFRFQKKLIVKWTASLLCSLEIHPSQHDNTFNNDSAITSLKVMSSCSSALGLKKKSQSAGTCPENLSGLTLGRGLSKL